MSARPLMPPFRLVRPFAAWRLLPLLLIALGLVSATVAGTAAQGAAPRVDVVRVDGTITPPMARYVGRALDRAAEDGAAAVVIELDTPGGLASAMDDIIDDILGSEVPVVVYVGPRGARAASAGVFIAYAAHVAAMAPGTRIGSASPVTIGDDGDTSDNEETLARKVTNDAVSQIKNLAQLRDRNAEWAERAVRDAVNVTADEALALGVVDYLAPDVKSLLAQIDGRGVRLETGEVALRTRGAELREVDMGPVEQFLQLLADPTIAYALLSLGALGLFLELSNPGSVLPGVVGGLALLMGLYGLGTLPVNWAGVLLIGFAFLLFVVDLFVPSFGTLTVGGVVSFVLGSYLLIGEDAPPGFEIARPVIWTVTALLVAFFLFVGASVLRARFRRPATGREGLLGDVGIVRRALDPRGVVHLQGELWQAVAADATAPILADAPVVAVALDGQTHTVRPATAPEVAAARAPEPDRRAVVPATGS